MKHWFFVATSLPLFAISGRVTCLFCRWKTREDNTSNVRNTVFRCTSLPLFANFGRVACLSRCWAIWEDKTIFNTADVRLTLESDRTRCRTSPGQQVNAASWSSSLQSLVHRISVDSHCERWHSQKNNHLCVTPPIQASALSALLSAFTLRLRAQTRLYGQCLI